MNKNIIVHKTVINYEIYVNNIFYGYCDFDKLTETLDKIEKEKTNE